MTKPKKSYPSSSNKDRRDKDFKLKIDKWLKENKPKFNK